MDLLVPNAQDLSDYFRSLLTDILDELVDEVPDGYTSNTETVKQSLRNVSNLYKTGLRFANSKMRSDWDDPANRCAYVFLYLMHHCYLVCGSLQHSDEVTRSWRNKNSLRVCSIGGGPGSDLVGLTTFLREQGIFPPSLECLVLDLYPSWKDTWDTIYGHLPETFTVAYRKCDLVKDTRLHTRDLQFVKQADIITLSKSFSAVSAFFRADRAKGALLRQILQEVKPGCFVLYIDNECGGSTQFQRDFADRAGLNLVFEIRGAPSFPKGNYSDIIRKYHRLFEFSPMRTCSVTIQLFRKKGAVLSGHAVRIKSTPTGQNRAQSSSKQATVQQGVPSVGTVSSSSRVVPRHRDDVISNYSISSRAASDIGPAYPTYNQPLSSTLHHTETAKNLNSRTHTIPSDVSHINIYSIPHHPARGTVGQHPPRNARSAPDKPITQTPCLTKTGDTRCYQPRDRIQHRYDKDETTPGKNCCPQACTIL